MRRVMRVGTAAMLAAGALMALPGTAAGQVETVLTGVDNGRGVTFSANGTLYVAASGVGGEGPCASGPEGPEGGEVCYGETGAILALPDAAGVGAPESADDHVLIGELPSAASQEDGDLPAGSDASGPAGVAIDDEDGIVYYTIGLGAPPEIKDDPSLQEAGKIDMFATLRAANAGDGSGDTEVADLADHEATDPDGQGADTNPFGVVFDTSSDTAIVADSGGNTILNVDDAGNVETNTVLPPTFVPAPAFIGAPSGTRIPAQAVPTGLALREDGSVDVGQLTGFPFQPGSSIVHHVTGGQPMPVAMGFTNVMDVAWHGGDLYVLEIAHGGLLNATDGPPTGALIRVSFDGDTVTRELLLAGDELIMPGGMAFDPTDEGMVYMTVGSASPDGAVMRFDTSTAEPLLTIVDDAATTDEDQRLVAGDSDAADQFSATTADVAANDTGVETVTVVDAPSGAVSNGSIVYQPTAHTTGVDAVTYQGCGAGGVCMIGILSVTIETTSTDRIAGENRVATAVKASQGRFPSGAPAVVIAREDLYPDALAGGPLAKAAGGPILLTSRDGLDPLTAAEIQRLGATTAYLLGGPTALSSEVQDAVSDIVAGTTRLRGADRFATAVRISEELATVTEEPLTHAYVVEGADADPNRGWPDAVAVSALASFTGRPILLTETDELPTATTEVLDGLDRATIVGGRVAVSAGVASLVREQVGTLDRIAGDTRYETSRLVAEAALTAGMTTEALTLVSGGNWPDALVAGPLVATTGGSFMLVHPTDVRQSPETSQFVEDHEPFADIDVFGGPAAIANRVVNTFGAGAVG